MADLFHYRTLTAAINQIKPLPRLIYNTLLKNNVTTFADKRVEFDLETSSVNIVPFSDRKQPGVAIKAKDYNHYEITPPSIKLTDTIPFDQAWTERLPGDNLANGIPGDVIRRKIGRSQKLMKDRIFNTIEYMAASILLTGAFSYNGRTKFEFDFSVPTGYSDATADWSDTSTANPIEDIRGWKSLIGKATGFNADVAFVHPDVVNVLLANELVLKYLDNRRMNVGTLEMGSEYLGRLAGVDLYEFNETVTDFSGSSYNLQGTADKFILTSREAWKMLFAASFVEDGPVKAEVFSNSWLENNPRARVISAESHPLPVITHNTGIVIATITTA